MTSKWHTWNFSIFYSMSISKEVIKQFTRWKDKYAETLK